MPPKTTNCCPIRTQARASRLRRKTRHSRCIYAKFKLSTPPIMAQLVLVSCSVLVVATYLCSQLVMAHSSGQHQSSLMHPRQDHAIDHRQPMARLVAPWRQTAANFRDDEFIMQSSSSLEEQQLAADKEASAATTIIATAAAKEEDDESTTIAADQTKMDTTKDTNEPVDDDKDDGRIPINATRSQYLTHDQLQGNENNVTDQSPGISGPVNESSVSSTSSFGSKIAQTSRAGMSRLASSFGLGDLFSRYAARPRPPTPQATLEHQSTSAPPSVVTTTGSAQASSPAWNNNKQDNLNHQSTSSNSCPGVCLDLISASIRCRNAIAAASCPSFFQKCCELDDVSFNGTPVETSAPITGGDLDPHPMPPVTDLSQVGNEHPAGRQTLPTTTPHADQQAQTTPSPAQPTTTTTTQPPPPTSGQRQRAPTTTASPVSSMFAPAGEQPQHQQQLHIASAGSHQGSVYFLSSGNDNQQQPDAERPDQHLDQQQLQPDGGKQQQQATYMAQPAGAQPGPASRLKGSASQSFDLPVSGHSTSELANNLSDNSRPLNRVVVLQTANGTTYLMSNGNQLQQSQATRTRPLYANWTDYQLLMTQVRPQHGAPVVYHSNINPVRKFATTTLGPAAQPASNSTSSLVSANLGAKVTSQPDLGAGGSSSPEKSSPDSELMVIKDQHSSLATSRQRTNSISSSSLATTTSTTTTTTTTPQPTTTVTTSTTTTTTTAQPTPATPPDTNQEATAETTMSPSDQQPPAGGGIASVLTSLFDAFMSSSAPQTNDASHPPTPGGGDQPADVADDSRIPQDSGDTSPTLQQPADLSAYSSADTDQTDRRVGLDLSFRQKNDPSGLANGSRFQMTGESASDDTNYPQNANDWTTDELHPPQASGGATSHCNAGYCALDQFVGLCDSWHVADECGAAKKCCITGTSSSSNGQPQTNRPSLCHGTCLPIYHSSLCTKPNELQADTSTCLPNQVCCSQPDSNDDQQQPGEGYSSQSDANHEDAGQTSTTAPADLSIAGSLIAALLPPPLSPSVSNQHSGETPSNQDRTPLPGSVPRAAGTGGSNQVDHSQQHQYHQTRVAPSLLASTNSMPTPAPPSTGGSGGIMNHLFQMFRSNTGLGKQRPPKNPNQQPNLSPLQTNQMPMSPTIQQQQQHVYFAPPMQIPQINYETQAANTGLMAASASAPRPQMAPPQRAQVSFQKLPNGVAGPLGPGVAVMGLPQTSGHLGHQQAIQANTFAHHPAATMDVVGQYPGHVVKPAQHYDQQRLITGNQNAKFNQRPGQASMLNPQHVVDTQRVTSEHLLHHQSQHQHHQMPPQPLNTRPQNYAAAVNQLMGQQHPSFVIEQQLPAAVASQHHQQVNFANNMSQQPNRLAPAAYQPSQQAPHQQQQLSFASHHPHPNQAIGQQPPTTGGFKPTPAAREPQQHIVGQTTKWSPAGQQQNYLTNTGGLSASYAHNNNGPASNSFGGDTQMGSAPPMVTISGVNHNNAKPLQAQPTSWVAPGAELDHQVGLAASYNNNNKNNNNNLPPTTFVSANLAASRLRPIFSATTTTAPVSDRYYGPEVGVSSTSDTNVVSAFSSAGNAHPPAVNNHPHSSRPSTGSTVAPPSRASMPATGSSSSLAQSPSNLNVLVTETDPPGVKQIRPHGMDSSSVNTKSAPSLAMSSSFSPPTDYDTISESPSAPVAPLTQPTAAAPSNSMGSEPNEDEESQPPMANDNEDNQQHQNQCSGVCSTPRFGLRCQTLDRMDDQAYCPRVGDICCVSTGQQSNETNPNQANVGGDRSQAGGADSMIDSGDLSLSNNHQDHLLAQDDTRLSSVVSTDLGTTRVHSTACGLPGPARHQRQSSGHARGRVMGGFDSEPGYWCWQAALMNGKNEYLCGGALIGSKWVLTAAHCVTQHLRSENQLFVRLGQWNLNSSSLMERQSAKSLMVKTSYVHHNHNGITLDNDIALLRLDESLDLSAEPSICTICLPDRPATGGSSSSSSAPLEPGKRCTVTGYGYETEAGPAALRVRQTELPIVADSECQNRTSAVLEKPFSLPASSFCAGGELGQDACHGDGGSPLACRHPEGYYELTGLVSWGYKCGHKDLPGLYARVSNFVGWINQIVSVNN